MTGTSPILVVMLAPPQPVLALRDDAPEQITLSGDAYTDAGRSDFTGFYDWLRSRGGDVVGVRYWPFEAAQPVVAPIASLPYVERGQSSDSYEIYFSAAREVDPATSGDQAFGGNRLLATAGGAIALTFDTRGLDARELLTLPAHSG